MITLSNALTRLQSNFFSTVQTLLSPAQIAAQLDGFRQRNRLYYGHRLFYPFLYQVLRHTSCQQAVLDAIDAALLPPDVGKHNAAFCQARLALPEAPLQALCEATGRTITAGTQPVVPGRRVLVVDGTTCRLADTDANQKEYPQNGSQRAGCGSPLVYLLAMMNLSSGAVLHLTFGHKREHDSRRFTRLWPMIEAGDIVLGDKAFDAYRTLAALQERQADGLFAMHTRVFDKSQAQELGPDDYLLRIRRPAARASDAESMERWPEELVVRVIRARWQRPGFRDIELWLITTLVDPTQYPAPFLSALYRRRWEMELRLRDIKTTMGMGHLPVKSPAMARKLVWMYLIAYNLVRAVMLDAAAQAGCQPGRISFKVTLSRLRSTAWDRGGWNRDESAYLRLLACLAALQLPRRDRPSEPRLLKNRPNKYKTRHRSWAKARKLLHEKQQAKQSEARDVFQKRKYRAKCPSPA
ncbi:MAG: IS4 family transposase [Terriglobales bacterium]